MKKLLLSLTIIFAFNANSQDCSELFISEYVEGPGNNNAIEIYNPTNSSIDLAGYIINRYSNGSSSGPESWQLGGTIASGDVIVIGNGQIDSVWVSTYWSLPVDPSFYSMLDLHCNGDYDANSTFYFNGDDAMTLEKNGSIIDILGKVGEDPGSAWTDDVTAGYTDANGGTWWTKYHTLIRKPTVKTGVIQNPILFNPTAEYDSLPFGTYSEMGSHSCDCATTAINENENVTYVMYPNPVVKGTTVTINSKNKIKKIELINILGEKIVSINSNFIPTNNLKKGTYIINILFSDGKKIDNKLIIE
ncbi:MAG: T9SS type A sorting domain-containing protein [Flavobacteriales bacterium]|jgi:hypothetical protein|nr:T9SS type A sorting domain-containing protein [Flavobacteriales bacterium]MBT6014090.1 T9SS type A sorting domain-containing protein [Flavobacteriales bacterium]MBT7481870.1 T9SS type A sorting domain-containing protein [Flavobacteriales bacterium]